MTLRRGARFSVNYSQPVKSFRQRQEDNCFKRLNQVKTYFISPDRKQSVIRMLTRKHSNPYACYGSLWTEWSAFLVSGKFYKQYKELTKLAQEHSKELMGFCNHNYEMFDDPELGMALLQTTVMLEKLHFKPYITENLNHRLIMAKLAIG